MVKFPSDSSGKLGTNDDVIGDDVNQYIVANLQRVVGCAPCKPCAATAYSPKDGFFEGQDHFYCLMHAIHNALGSDAEPALSKGAFDLVKAGNDRCNIAFDGGRGARGLACYVADADNEGFNSLTLELLLPRAGFAWMQLCMDQPNVARAVAMLDTGLVLGGVLHKPSHWVAFRRQSNGTFVHLDSLDQQGYPETLLVCN